MGNLGKSADISHMFCLLRVLTAMILNLLCKCLNLTTSLAILRNPRTGGTLRSVKHGEDGPRSIAFTKRERHLILLRAVTDETLRREMRRFEICTLESVRICEKTMLAV